MEFKFVLGVDMSKNHFNYALMNSDFDLLMEGQVINRDEAIFSFISQLLDHPELDSIDEVLLIMEHTGIYVQLLAKNWLSKQGQLSIVPANNVSDLLNGGQKWAEKTDQIDARRLAEYAFRYADRLHFYQVQAENLEILKRLQRQRSRLQDAINLLEVPARESAGFDTAHISQLICDNQSQSVEALKADLKKVEKQLQQIIKQDDQLQQLFDWITSVPGIGPVTAREILITTHGFQKFSPQQAKSFSKYAGVVPLPWQSGKVRKKSKTSKRANKQMKKLLTMGARSLIGTYTELGIYYDRKLREGKPHKSVINAMRNKMILRVFAVVRNQTMYQKNLQLT